VESHNVTCHLTEVRIPLLPPAETGTRFSDIGAMQGSVDLCYLKEDRLGTDPATCKSQVQRPTAEPPRNSLSLSVAGAVMMNPENWSAFHEVTGKRIVAPFRLTVATSFFVPPRSEVNKNYRCSSTVCTSNLFGQYRPIN